MQHPTDITGKVFSELKKLFKTLSESDEIEALLAKNEELTKMQNLIAYLKVHHEYQSDVEKTHELAHPLPVAAQDAVLTPEENKHEINISFDAENLKADRAQNELEAENITEPFETASETASDTQEESFTEIAPLQEIINEEAVPEQALEHLFTDPISSEEDPQREYLPISQKEVALLEKKHEAERKFRLSQIKGVKKMHMQSEEESPADDAIKNEASEARSLAKSNVSLDYMEAEKPAPAFKLDLNDRIAFTKRLFSGSQADLNFAVSKLNSFTTLEEAKEYLSEIYYERNWAKEDEYAQRLWSLVESKF